MKKQLLSLTLAALMLTACSGSDSSTAAGADLSAVEVKNAYNGAEELMGRDYGKFSMPSSFEVPTLTNVYTIDYNTVPPKYDRDKLAKLFADFLGDKFFEFEMKDDGMGGVYYIPEEGSNTGAYYGSDGIFSLSIDVDRGEDVDFENYSHYFVDNNFDMNLDLNGVDTTVAQQAAFVDSEINTLFEGFFDSLELKTNALDVYSDGFMHANIAFAMDGVILQSWKGDYERIIERQGREFYETFMLGAEVTPDSKITMIYALNIPTVVSRQPVDRIISLKRAVGILQSDLPDNASYSFSDVRLMYCHKSINPRISSTVTDPELDSQQQAEYNSNVRTLEPMWCFFIEKPDEYIGEMIVKVNAITGEVDYDIAPENQ
ncbi:MAG: hypothetical protein IJ561_00890 [Ruminococcus sp.]|nr:hypothetical protein [Ruminococcus sp.]